MEDCGDSSRELPLRGALGVPEPTLCRYHILVFGWELGSAQKGREGSHRSFLLLPSAICSLSWSYSRELLSQSLHVLSMESYPGLGCVP